MKQLILFVLTFLPLTASADAVKIDGIYYNLNAELHQAEVTSSPDNYSGSVNIPDKVTYESVEYSVTSIGYNAFIDCSDLTSVTIPNSVTSIGIQAFAYCKIANITIPHSVTSIKYGAFTCSDITSVFIPENVTSIDNEAFYCCDKLNSVTISDGVTSIGTYAFYRCRDLISITIPGSVTSIGSGAFNYCNGLCLVIVKNQTPSTIDRSTFSNRVNATLYVPKGSKEAYENADYWKEFKEIKEFANDEEVNFSKRTIHVETAGTLPTLLSANERYLIEELTLSGELNGTDIHLLRDLAGVNLDEMDGEYFINVEYNEYAETRGKLSFLDLSDATIVEGGRDYYRMQTSSADETWDYYQYTKANAISDCMFAEFKNLKQLILPRSVTQISNPLCDLYAWSTYPLGISVLKVADGNRYYDSRNDCNAVIETSTNTLIAGCPSTIIPESVTTIGNNAFRAINNMTSITIPVGVTAINDYAFYSCSSLSSIIIPSSVTSIGNYAFSDCNSLQSLIVEATTPPSIAENTFPNRANMILHVPAGSVEAYAVADYWKEFKGIGAIGGIVKGEIFSAATAEGVVLSFSVTNTSPFEAEVCGVGEYDDTSFDKSTVTIKDIPSSVIGLGGNEFRVTGIGNSAFSGCNGLTSISIPESVTSIGSGAFSGCNNLTSIVVESDNPNYDSRNNCNAIIEKSSNTLIIGCNSTIIPSSVTTIGNSAFAGCSGLTSVTIPNSVTSIGNSAFAGCSGLTSITIPNSITSIGDYAFQECSGLTSVTIPNSVTSINDYAFSGCSGLTSVTIPSSMTSIGYGAFYDCSGLTSITIPNSVTGIGDYAFSGCSGLTSVTIPYGVTSIGTSAFTFCRNLIAIALPNSVTSIGRSAFSSCSGLTSVTIPNSVTSIGSWAFSSCQALTSVTVDIREPLSINTWTFSNRTKATLYVPNGSKAAYEVANVWKDFKEIKEFVKDEEVTYTIENDNSVIVTAANDQQEKDVVIPESVMIDGEPHAVTAIDNGAFKDNTALSLVCIPETIEEIGDNAFAGCSNMKAIYSYTEEPVDIGDAKATVRTRADGGEVSASTVFAEVDKATCILYVPKNCSDKYRTAVGWSEFQNIIEMKSSELGDANNDTIVDEKDVDATVGYIMEGKTENFIFKNADVKTDNNINAADIVKIINSIP